MTDAARVGCWGRGEAGCWVASRETGQGDARVSGQVAARAA